LDVPVEVLQRLYANVPLMMGVVELHGDDDILHVSDNPATAAFFGTTPNATQGQLASALGVDVDTRRLWVEHYRKSHQTSCPIRFEYAHETPDETRWLEAMVSHIGLEPATGQERYAYCVEDITARVVQRETARANENRQTALLRALPDLMFRIDQDGRYLDIHAPDPGALAAPVESLLGRTLEEVLPSHLAEQFLRQIRDAIVTGVVAEVKYDMVTADGVERHFEARISPDVGHSEALIVVRDLTEWTQDRRALSVTAERLRTLIDSLQAAVLMEDEGRQVLVANQAFCDLFLIDAPPAALAGANAVDALEAAKHHFASPDETVDRIHALIGAQQAVFSETVEFANGKTLERDYIPVDLDGAYGGHLWLYHDITDRQEMEDELFRQAFHDPLTGLPNRALLNARLESALDSPEGAEDIAMVFVDLDRFKVVNDTLGHSFGDQLLQEVAKRLQLAVRPEDTVARLGGDEFALLIDGLPEADYAVGVAQQIVDVLQIPVVVDGRELYAGASVGVSTGHPGQTDSGALLREADLAMYAAKAAGRSTYAVYNEASHSAATQRLQLEMDLRHAIERGELRVVYQPIVGLRDGVLAGFEALVRWEHPQLGLLMPDAFLGPAEESGQMELVDQWVLREACRQTAEWAKGRGDGRTPLRIHVNCSGRDLASSGFSAGVLQALNGQGLNPEHLSLEITEHALVEDTEGVSKQLRRLQESGVRFSLDDFGTGYSSLSMLHALPVDTIKVDRSFVGDMDASAASRQLVEMVVGLGKMLGKSVVAEGIEGFKQLGALRQMECAFGQGYFFNRPLSAADATALALSKTTPWHGHWATA